MLAGLETAGVQSRGWKRRSRSFNILSRVNPLLTCLLNHMRQLMSKQFSSGRRFGGVLAIGESDVVVGSVGVGVDGAG